MNININRETEFIDLGMIGYQKAWDFQTRLLNETVAIKVENRSKDNDHQTATKNFLIYCEHPHVFTLGKTGDEKNLLVKPADLPSLQADFIPTNRGGDITYHGPGQLVVYPVLDLENFFTDIHQYMRSLEEAVILTLHEYGIRGGRIDKLTGVWIDPEQKSTARKICAMGVKMSRWVTLHGLALNVNADLKYFDYIVPCGINDKAVTSMAKELGREIPMEEIKKILKEKIIGVFGLKLKS
ncbi:MAG TPA: lipoyl(octanoyl) transferase LipB [Cyclobacteriaceae bacterium]|nr:lipoyl(octanoyl) transferase LipB [Cyclobacteriaceae bacterium]